MIRAIAAQGGRALLVGGAVRDAVWGQATTDFDLEVYHIQTLDELRAIVLPFGPVAEAGKCFGVLKLAFSGFTVDLALPRRESAVGIRHQDFQIAPDPEMPFECAAGRRDFTMNSMGYDPLTGMFFDPFNGLADCESRILRHVSDAFVEDPLRVLRAMQFAGRFQCRVDPATRRLCRSMVLNALPKARIFEEFKRLLLASQIPSRGLALIPDLGIDQLFPELAALYDVPQDPVWHPEGDVWQHTLATVDRMACLRPSDSVRALRLMLAALCHDFGKPLTTAFVNGRWRSPGHEAAGVPAAAQFLARMTDQARLISDISALVRDHLKPSLLHQDHQNHAVSNAAIRRLALRVPISDLVLLAQADHASRFPADEAPEYVAGCWLLARAEQLNIQSRPPEPVLKGRHLLALGLHPGPRFGPILRAAFQAQLDGVLISEDDAINFAKSML